MTQQTFLTSYQITTEPHISAIFNTPAIEHIVRRDDTRRHIDVIIFYSGHNTVEHIARLNFGRIAIEYILTSSSHMKTQIRIFGVGRIVCEGPILCVFEMMNMRELNLTKQGPYCFKKCLPLTIVADKGKMISI